MATDSFPQIIFCDGGVLSYFVPKFGRANFTSSLPRALLACAGVL